MRKNKPPRFTHNLALDTVDGITFLNTEAFSNYMSKFDPEVIKPLVFEADKPFEFKSIDEDIQWQAKERKKQLHIVTALD